MRRATFADKQLIIEILAPAFATNKSVNYIVKQDEHRVERIRGLMDYSFNMCNEFGEVWISADNLACALVIFNDKQRTSLRSLWWDLRLAISVIGLSRVNAIMRREKLIKSNHPKEPIAYLLFLGVDTRHQGSGAGSALLREIINRYDGMNRPVYLETSMERNLPFYRKQGFEIFSEIQLSYRLYLLRRIILNT
jgi:ribosomal protein S18 acetylase RimI-like enzyme